MKEYLERAARDVYSKPFADLSDEEKMSEQFYVCVFHLGWKVGYARGRDAGLDEARYRSRGQDMGG